MKPSRVQCSKCGGSHKTKQEITTCGELKKIKKSYNRNKIKNNKNE